MARTKVGTITAVAALSCPHVAMVSPQVRKTHCGITADNTEARAFAQAITGDLQSYRRVQDHDRAKAVLISLYGFAMHVEKGKLPMTRS